MANLNSRSTDGRLSWDKYVSDNDNWKDLVLETEEATQLFARKGIKLESILELPQGTKFKLKTNRYETILNKKFAKATIDRKDGYIPLTAIRKPTAFKPTGYEVEVVNLINNAIAQNYNMPMDIKLKGDSTIYKGIQGALQVDTALKRRAGVSADPKADIVLYHDKSNPLSPKNIYISHKKEGGPEAFQQYGGLTKTSGKDIYEHPETKSFLEQVIEYIDPEKGLTVPLFKKIDSKSLINMSIFGPGYGGRFDLQHVTLIGQGLPVLTPMRSDNVYELDFSSHMSLSGDIRHFTEGYTPVFGATFRAGRGFELNNKRYDGVRVGIYPIKLIETRKGVLELK